MRCVGCAYVDNCIDCSECQYCYGCVGLTGSEFHILNEAYDRSTYFELTAKLSRVMAPPS